MGDPVRIDVLAWSADRFPRAGSFSFVVADGLRGELLAAQLPDVVEDYSRRVEPLVPGVVVNRREPLVWTLRRVDVDGDLGFAYVPRDENPSPRKLAALVRDFEGTYRGRA